MLFMLKSRTGATDLEVRDVEARGDVACKRIVPVHSHLADNPVVVPGSLSLRNGHWPLSRGFDPST
jgi:hypothetical protein